MGYITGYNYYLDKYYTDENKASWTEKYHLVNTDDDTNDDIYDINIPFESGHPKLWIVFEEGGCMWWYFKSRCKPSYSLWYS